MIHHKTLAKYLGKMFIQQFLIISAIIICVLIITNAFDVLQKFKSVNITLNDFGKLISFKIPYLFSEVVPLVAFISTFSFLRNMSKQQELVIILSSGVSLWRVFIPHLLVTFFLGAVVINLISLVGTYGLQAYSALDSKIHKTQSASLVISQSGLLIFENFTGENRIIQARSINTKTSVLKDITVLIIDEHNNLEKRIDSPRAILKSDKFELTSPLITTKEGSEKLEDMSLLTNISIDSLLQRFTPPEMISMWNLKSSIKEFDNSGLAVTKYQIYYYKQIFKPFFMLAMSLVACWFISLNTRDKSGTRVAILGLVSGVVTYFFLEMMVRILAYSGLNPMLSVLLPLLFIILISKFVILHFQEA